MSLGFTEGSGKGTAGKKKYTQKRRLDRQNSMIGSAVGPGITAYNQGPTYTLNDVQAMNSMPAAQAAAATAPPYSVPAPTGTGPSATNTGATGGQNAQEFGNEYFWNSPEWAMNNAFTQAYGSSPNINNSFYNAMLEQAPGLKFMHLFTEGMNNPKEYVSTWGDQMGNWLSSGQFGGWGDLASAGSALFGLGGGGGMNPGMEGYIDSLDPKQAIQMMSSMLGTAAYGHMGPELVSGLVNQMQQAYSDFGGMLPSLMDPTGSQSDMSIFTDFMRQNANDVFNFLGF